MSPLPKYGEIASAWANRTVPMRVTFPIANTRRDIAHGLGVIPDGYLVVWSDTAIKATPGVAWTPDLAYLQSSASYGHATVIFYTLMETASDDAAGSFLPVGPVPPSTEAVGLHAPTHSAGGTDPVTVTTLAGYPGGSSTFLRADGSFAAIPPTFPTIHATTHLLGGSDPVIITALAGYPGGTSNFLRADGTFAAIPLAMPLIHATTHLLGGSDPITITMLAGFTGGTTNFLRADGVFAAPTGFLPALHATTHLLGGSDPITITTLAGFTGGTANFLRADGVFAAPTGITPATHASTHALSGSDPVTGPLHLTPPLYFNASGSIIQSTGDGVDNRYLSISAGGAAPDASRGSYISFFGNEYVGAGGAIGIATGNVAGSYISLVRNDGSPSLKMDGSTGLVTVSNGFAGPSSAPLVMSNPTGISIAAFECPNEPGGYLTITKSGGAYGYMGASLAVGGGLTSTDMCIRATKTLQFMSDNNNIKAAPIYNAAIGLPANVVVESGGALSRSTSSRKYKTAIEPLDDWRFLLDLTPVTFASRADPDGRRFGGLIAEEVAEVNDVFAVRGADGAPEEVAYTHLTAPIIAAIQELTRRLVALERHT